MNYTIRFTNPSKATFTVVENGTNGPDTPNSNALMPDAVSANTTLQLLGQRRVQYGQPVWQDFVYMLENFANSTPPSYPIQGQLWYNDTTLTLSVYDGGAWQSIQSGAVTADLDMNGYKIINLAPPTSSGDAVNLGYADGAYVNVSGDTMNVGANLTFNGGQVLGLPAIPTTSSAATSKQYVDNQDAAIQSQLANYLPLTGGTLTGPLTISSGNLTISTGNASVGGTLTITGATTMNSTAHVVGATTLDSSVTIGGTTQLNSTLTVAGTSTFNSPVNIVSAPLTISAGGYLDMSNGYINNVAYPINSGNAANKQYVDDQVLGGGGNNITGGDISTVDGTVTLTKTSGTITLTGSAAPFVHTHEAPDVNLNVSNMFGNYLSQTAGSDSTYPNMAVSRALQLLDQAASMLMSNTQRYDRPGTGAATISLPFQYKVGANKLQVFVNGALQVLSSRSTAMFAFPNEISGPAFIITVPDTYAFNITVNGTLYTNVSIVNASTLSYNDLVIALNNQFTTLTIPAVAYIDNNALVIATNTVGAGSQVTIANPSAGTSLVAELISNDALLTNGVAQGTGGYFEVGAYGVMSNQFTMGVAPTVSDTVTAIVHPHFGAYVGLL